MDISRLSWSQLPLVWHWLWAFQLVDFSDFVEFQRQNDKLSSARSSFCFAWLRLLLIALPKVRWDIESSSGELTTFRCCYLLSWHSSILSVYRETRCLLCSMCWPPTRCSSIFVRRRSPWHGFLCSLSQNFCLKRYITLVLATFTVSCR